jgi:hypothetical protein
VNNETKQQAGDPEDVLVREERQQTQDGDEFELEFLVPQALGQRVQPEEQAAQPEHYGNDHNGCDCEKDVRVTGRC